MFSITTIYARSIALADQFACVPACTSVIALVSLTSLSSNLLMGKLFD